MTAVFAQSSDPSDLSKRAPATSYQVTPDDPSASPAPATDQSSAPDTAVSQGPVRLARFSEIEGDVTWRPTSGDDWSEAEVNVPVREGAQIWVTNGGRAEIQFDDGSYVRVGDGAIITLQTLYSDANGEFTEVRLNQGLVTLDLKNSSSIYQVDTPLTAVKADGVSIVRIGVNDGVEVAVRSGKAVVTGPNGSADLIDDNYLYLADTSTPFTIQSAPTEDSWDTWNDQRDATLSDAETDEHVPQNISVCAGNLDSYGIWREDPEYGWVWCPTVASDNWRPYEYGSWVYCEPFGWTWCSTEPWGWAPYHYGTWFHAGYGWAWCPGPARQYWCPAVVSFSDYNGDIGWCPLAPHEVNYTSLSFGFGRRGFAFGFSIAEAGCYYPGPSGLCVGVAFNSYNVNHYGRPGFVPRTPLLNRAPFVPGGRFVPRNARFGGLMTAGSTSFGSDNHYHAGPINGAEYFAHGNVVTAPRGDARPFSGPTDVRPVANSWSPSRTLLTADRPNPIVANRPVFRAPLPTAVARVAQPVNDRFIGAPSVAVPGPGAVENNSVADRAIQARQNLGIAPSGRGSFFDRNGTSAFGQQHSFSGNSNSGNNNQSFGTHIPDWNNQGSFHIDQGNSGGGYSTRSFHGGYGSNNGDDRPTSNGDQTNSPRFDSRTEGGSQSSSSGRIDSRSDSNRSSSNNEPNRGQYSH